MKFKFITALLLIFLSICSPIQVSQVRGETMSNNSHYFFKNPDNRAVVIFVHGVSGDPISTWTNSNGTYWPNLLKNDPDFDNASIYMIGYSSPLIANAYSINELAECMRRDLESDKVLNHSKLIFIAHSMGGLVTREFLLKYKDYADRVSQSGFIYFFATPTSGSSIARTMELLSQNPQYRKMGPLKSDDSLADIQRNWLASEQMTKIPSYGSYETKDTHGLRIVEQDSATQLCNRPVSPINKNHIDIVKPADIYDESYRAFKSAFLASRKSPLSFDTNSKKITTLSPEIKYKLAYPLKLEKDSIRKQTDNPELVITNVGPIKANAFSVDLKGYLYDKNRMEIDGSFELYNETHDHLIFVKELQPSENIKQQLNGFHFKDKVGIYIFTIKYYREPDMEVFSNQHIYFIDNYNIFPEKDYSTSTYYSKIMMSIKSFNPLKPEFGRMHFQALAADHAWFLKETPSNMLTMLNDDRRGVNVVSIPEDVRTVIKQKYLNENRPLLYIGPSKLKDSETYLGFDIIDDHTVNIKIRYEVENIGVTEAINVSEPGSVPYNKPLKPGEKIYLYPKVILTNESGHKQSPEELLIDLDKQEYIIDHGCSVLYYQESSDKEYMARFAYKIGKDKTQLIRYETK